MSTDFHDWYERVYPQLSGHGLWLRGGEPQTLPPEQYDCRSFRVLLARLSTYQDTAESFTHATLYAIALGWPGDKLLIKSLAPRWESWTGWCGLYPSEIVSITMLGDGRELKWAMTPPCSFGRSSRATATTALRLGCWKNKFLNNFFDFILK